MTERDKERREYLAERGAMVEFKMRSSDLYDRSALVISGVALVLSMIFLRCAASPLLFAGWAMLAVGILALLASQLTSQHACQKAADWMDRKYNGQVSEPEQNKWGCVTSVLNWISLVAIALGVLLVVVFVIQTRAQKVLP